ncbi:MAG TPA: hypothetical protein VHB98_17855 [Chloroflexota bacterium]|jgi:hypothetical protein|nr:hypothetical protein [Chloroflexota bacterium]
MRAVQALPAPSVVFLDELKRRRFALFLEQLPTGAHVFITDVRVEGSHQWRRHWMQIRRMI